MKHQITKNTTNLLNIYIKEKLARGYSPNGPADGTLGTIRVIKEG